jgi:AmmeMemoRadiSam system protein B
LEAVPSVEDGREVFVLRDLEELSDKPLALSAGGMLLMSLLDGRRTAAQARDPFNKSTGSEIDESVLLDLVGALNEAGYLETPEIAKKRAAALEAFRASPQRAAAFAGTAYAAAEPALGRELDAFFTADKGPGRAKAAAADKPAPLGLVAPHIDFARGGPAYAWAYRALSERRPPDVVVALGVAHVSPNSPWTFTPKSYATPLGAMRVDGELYDALARKVWYEPRADEWVHKSEHSLEFQAVWLRHLWGDKAPPWVPILVSSFERFADEKSPSTVPTVEKALKDFADVLREQTARGRRVTVLCGVDLAHVGPRFGDELEITPELEKKIEAEDRKSLVDALALDADGFYKSVVADGHWRKVCGLSALYTGLRLIKAMDGASPGRLLAYGQAPDPAGGVVSFASAVFDAAP